LPCICESCLIFSRRFTLDRLVSGDSWDAAFPAAGDVKASGAVGAGCGNAGAEDVVEPMAPLFPDPGREEACGAKMSACGSVDAAGVVVYIREPITPPADGLD
jgi:hypothetical protein